MKRNAIGLALLLALSLSACATWQRSGESYYERYRIVEEEIAEYAGQVRNLYQLIERRRPQWLEADVVYQDQTYLGGVSILTSLAPDFGSSMEYLDASQAGAKLPGLAGRHVSGGAIVIYR